MTGTMDLLGLHFIRPLWFLALPPMLLLTWFCWRHRKDAPEWGQFMSAELREHLLQRRSGNRAPVLLLLFAWLTIIIALAGPSWRKLQQPAEQRADALVILVDLSPSMYSKDILPSRLERVRNKVNDILRRRREGLTALVAYGGDSFTITPLTDDTGAIGNLLQSLSPKLLPVQGSNASAAVEDALQLLQNSGGDRLRGRLLLITDGIREREAAQLTRALQETALPLLILGVGTRSGAPVQLPGGGFLRDKDGAPVIASFNPAPLQRLAGQNRGRYHSLSIDDGDIDYLLDESVLNQGQTRETERKFDLWREEGPWLLLALLPVAALSFRRGWLLLLALAFTLGAPSPARAFSWQDLWLKKDQQAARALEDNDPTRAAELFEHPDWRGVALYRAGEYEEALQYWNAEDSARSHYNRGNALVHAGRIAEAIKAYQTALEVDPEFEDAQHNLDVLLSALEQASQQQQQQGQGQPQQGQQGQQQQGQQGQQQQGQQGQQQGQQGQQEQQGPQQGPGQHGPEPPDGESQQAGQSAEDQEQDRRYLEEMAQKNQAGGEKSEEGKGEQQKGRKADGEQENNAAQQDGEGEESAQSDAAKKAFEELKNKDLDSLLEELGSLGATGEQDHATEMWLRRVSENPTGLLSNKLLYQHRQRQKHGESRADKQDPGL